LSFQTCLHCKGTGLVHALKIGTQNRYVFSCSCVFGPKGTVWPIWGNPTRGFIIEEVELAKSSSNRVADIIGIKEMKSEDKKKDPFDD